MQFSDLANVIIIKYIYIAQGRPMLQMRWVSSLALKSNVFSLIYVV